MQMRNDAIQLNVWKKKHKEEKQSKSLLVLLFKALYVVAGLCLAMVLVYLLSFKSEFVVSVMPIKHIEIKNELSNERAIVVKSLMANVKEKSFLNIDLGKAQLSIENLSWVDEVALGREWPDRIYVDIKESVPLAIWNDKHVGLRGNVFEQENKERNLPVFNVSEGMLPQAIKTYISLQNDFKEVGLYIQKIKIDDRGSVSFELDNTTRLILGSNNVLHKNALAKKIMLANDTKNKIIDMRYENGFAISETN